MTAKEIVDKLWNLCNVLRDDGITYHQYVNELTYILFLKLAQETGAESNIPVDYRWSALKAHKGAELKSFYRHLLKELGDEIKTTGTVQRIYAYAQSSIDHPANLEKIIKSIDQLDWYSAKQEGLGNLYEGLLEKNAGEKKSGAGQYFTPRPLINVLVRCIDPKPGEACNDPACGTFGFMISTDHYLRGKYDDYNAPKVDKAFQLSKALSGVELVSDTYRLALMNAMLHDLSGESLYQGDTLSDFGEQFMETYDVVLSNPPFGVKKGGERPSHGKLTIKSTNKQLNFLQHIYLSLKSNGNARAAVVLPDNVLFVGGEGQKIRTELMDKCNLHTVLRLPSRTFDYAGVQTNVLFFKKGKKDKGNTKEVWFYDLRSGLPNFGKRTPLTEQLFADFEQFYHAADRHSMHDPRATCYKRQQIGGKEDSLDLGLKQNENGKMVAPEVLAHQTRERLQIAMERLDKLVKILEV